MIISSPLVVKYITYCDVALDCDGAIFKGSDVQVDIMLSQNGS